MSGIMLNVVGGTYGGIPVIGSAFGGGFFAGQISTAGNGVADYNRKPPTLQPLAQGQSLMGQLTVLT